MSKTVIIQSKGILVFLLVSFIITGTVSTTIFNTSYGTLTVTNITIENNSIMLSGTLYRPIKASINNTMPAVICLHGFMNAKTTMSGISLELARRDFVTLALDAVGHGNSEGGLGGDDPTLGVLAAVNYVRSLDFVNPSLIGLVGHSMGAAAVRATALIDKNISATVLIGGGISTLGKTSYGTINSTFPRNLLIAIGKYDQFFPDITKLKQDLKPIFGLNEEQELSENYAYYGSFETQTARRLVISETIHLFEPVDNTIVSEIVSWMHNSLKSPDAEIKINFNNQIYVFREFLMLLTTLALLVLTVVSSVYIYESIGSRFQKLSSESYLKGLKTMEWYFVMIIWGVLSLGLFLPMSLIGGIINFPPIILGSSLFWWVSAVALSGFTIILYFNQDYLRGKINSRLIKASLMKKETLVISSLCLAIFIFLYISATFYELLFKMDLHFVIPLLNDLIPLNRIMIFALFVPAFLLYFFVEGLYFNVILGSTKIDEQLSQKIALLGKQLILKTLPYLIILLIIYLPSLLFGAHLIQGTMFPLIIQILWVIIPLFWGFTIISWWFFDTTSNITTGIILNALLISWFLAALLPFGSFPF
ncbi:MAG: alpha/beta hydrolase [Candidatus Hodarchaeales archaeon]